MPVKILIVEDEAALVVLLRYNLESEGYHVRSATTGEEAKVLLNEERPDLVILDWMLPGISGIEICRQIRARPETRAIPIIMLTARGEEGDRIRGLATGADDYVVKPFSVAELMARINTILRRAAPERVADVITVGEITVNRAAHRVMRRGRELRLGPTEYRVLVALMQSAGRVLSRAQLLDEVWGRDGDVDERTVDVHIGRLRRALGNDSEAAIRTVRGAGYMCEGAKAVEARSLDSSP